MRAMVPLPRRRSSGSIPVATAAVMLALAASLAVGACSEPRVSGVADAPRIAVPAPAELASVTFALTPFRSIPGNIADDLTRFLIQAARREGLTVLRRPRIDTTYRIDGVASAISDDTNSLVFYVFDIYGADGRRLHRIRGQQPSNASPGDPWTGVENRDLRIVAARVAAQIRAWFSAAHP